MTASLSPKVSIVLPTYNGSKWLTKAVKSIINQTFQDWELIIVNDCSTDNTLAIIESLAAQDCRIKFISNNKNLKLPASLNIGFSIAKGEYYTWTSDDNVFKSNAIAAMASYLDRHPQTDMISMNSDIINENGEVIENFDGNYTYKRCVEYLIHMNNIGAAFMYRKTIAQKVGQYSEMLFCAEDYDYWCRIALAGKIDYSKENIYQYRVHSNSLSKTKRDLVKINTNHIRERYAPNFFLKYNFSLLDKAKLWAHHSNYHWPISMMPLCFLLKAQGLLVEIIASSIFWNKSLRKKVKTLLIIHNKYSFSVLNEK